MGSVLIWWNTWSLQLFLIETFISSTLHPIISKIFFRHHLPRHHPYIWFITSNNFSVPILWILNTTILNKHTLIKWFEKKHIHLAYLAFESKVNTYSSFLVHLLDLLPAEVLIQRMLLDSKCHNNPKLSNTHHYQLLKHTCIHPQWRYWCTSKNTATYEKTSPNFQALFSFIVLGGQLDTGLCPSVVDEWSWSPVLVQVVRFWTISMGLWKIFN